MEWIRSANFDTGKQVTAASQTGQMAASGYCVRPSENRLQPKGRPEVGQASQRLADGVLEGLVSSRGKGGGVKLATMSTLR